MKFITSIALVSSVLSCSKRDEEEDRKSTGVSIVLKSSQLINGSSERQIACTAEVTNNPRSGICITPLALSGSFSQAILISRESAYLSAKLFGNYNKDTEPSDIFKHADFDFKAMPDIFSEDENEEGGVVSASYLTIYAQWIEFAFQATSAQKVYRVRTFFVSSIPSTDPTFARSECRLSSLSEEVDSLGTLFPGVQAQEGDIMVCVRDNANEVCEDIDYKWIDSNNTLTSTRPLSPKNQSLGQSPSCSLNAATRGGARFNVAFSDTLDFTINDNKTYFTNAVSGTKLALELDINLTDGLFIPSTTNISNLSSAGEEDILKNITNIMLKNQFILREDSSRVQTNLSHMLQGTPKISLE